MGLALSANRLAVGALVEPRHCRCGDFRDWVRPGDVGGRPACHTPSLPRADRAREGRYAWILAVKDLASRCQLAWLPVEEQTAETVQAVYAQLFAEHGPPLVLKSDNGGPFRDEGTKRLLAEHLVVPLYNPRRRPAYNGGVERSNGQLAGYQEALAAFRGRATAQPAVSIPTLTCEDAASARNLASELAR
ncbi:MAG TPA: transposase family protein [Pirellulaceae bacterium]|nr:transposase family protein [Pirellulaceae bacterium]